MASSQEDNLGTQSSGHSCATVKRTSLGINQMDIHSRRNKNLFGKQLSGRSCAPIKRTISGNNEAVIHSQQLREQRWETIKPILMGTGHDKRISGHAWLATRTSPRNKQVDTHGQQSRRQPLEDNQAEIHVQQSKGHS